MQCHNAHFDIVYLQIFSIYFPLMTLSFGIFDLYPVAPRLLHHCKVFLQEIISYVCIAGCSDQKQKGIRRRCGSFYLYKVRQEI